MRPAARDGHRGPTKRAASKQTNMKKKTVAGVAREMAPRAPTSGGAVRRCGNRSSGGVPYLSVKSIFLSTSWSVAAQPVLGGAARLVWSEASFSTVRTGQTGSRAFFFFSPSTTLSRFGIRSSLPFLLFVSLSTVFLNSFFSSSRRHLGYFPRPAANCEPTKQAPDASYSAAVPFQPPEREARRKGRPEFLLVSFFIFVFWLRLFHPVLVSNDLSFRSCSFASSSTFQFLLLFLPLTLPSGNAYYWLFVPRSTHTSSAHAQIPVPVS